MHAALMLSCHVCLGSHCRQRSQPWCSTHVRLFHGLIMSSYLNSGIFPFTEECGIPPDSFVGRDAGGGHSRGGAVVYHGPVVHIALGLPTWS